MGARLFSTFVSGATAPIVNFLKQDIQPKIINEFDGLVEYQTDCPLERIIRLQYFQNTFIVIKSSRCSYATMMKKIIAEDVEKSVRDIYRASGLRKRSFRVLVSLANNLKSVDSNLLAQIENKIRAATGLFVNRQKPDIQFWILERSEGVSYFAMRYTQLAKEDKNRADGELRPQIAYLLARLSEPQERELFLDPFCGSGAIPLARLRMSRTGLIMASDIDKGLVEKFKEKVKKIGAKERIVVKCSDALHLVRYNDNSIHKIVSDPPWGFYEHIYDIQGFYRDMLLEMHRIIKEDGKIILLVANPKLFHSILDSINVKFNLERQYDILVSGKQASIFKMSKHCCPVKI